MPLLRRVFTRLAPYAALLAGGSALASCGYAPPVAPQSAHDARVDLLADLLVCDEDGADCRSPRLDEIQQRTVHNAYEQSDPVGALLEDSGFRSLELDIHTNKIGHAKREGKWFVYHRDFPSLGASSCATLEACMSDVAAFHEASPDHDPITVFVDLKDGFGPGHTPEQLDAELAKQFDVKSIWTPGDLFASCPTATTLRDAVTGSCGWPQIADLRGKILFALTGGTACGPSSKLDAYVDGGRTASSRLSFVAPNVNDECRAGDLTSAVIVNRAYRDLKLAPSIRKDGVLTRAYYGGLRGGLDNAEVWAEAIERGVNFLATDRVEAARHPYIDLGPRPLVNERGL